MSTIFFEKSVLFVKIDEFFVKTTDDKRFAVGYGKIRFDLSGILRG